jgi:hypothetical protein
MPRGVRVASLVDSLVGISTSSWVRDSCAAGEEVLYIRVMVQHRDDMCGLTRSSEEIIEKAFGISLGYLTSMREETMTGRCWDEYKPGRIHHHYRPSP